MNLSAILPIAIVSRIHPNTFPADYADTVFDKIIFICVDLREIKHLHIKP